MIAREFSHSSAYVILHATGSFKTGNPPRFETGLVSTS